MRPVYERCRFPLDWWKLTRNAKLSHFALPMAARQANCSYLPDVGLFRDFTFPHPQPTGNNRTFAFVTEACGEVKVLFSHYALQKRPNRQIAAHIFQMD
jgi:hypothetical protein